MKAQTPAEGILKTHDFGNSKWYQVVCGCGQSDHSLSVEVEAEDVGVSVNTYVTVKSPFWSMNRFKQIWLLLTRGYLEHESTIVMTEQQALNYAETIKSAIQDVKDFKKP